ncbi:MAG: hypothetical protein K0R30_3002 [Ornithinibacter sp.]|jgi:hypothetical protein|nr:hypothetical protein [Ornithinibacter sp.]
MTGSTQDHLLREVLARQAETQESPGYDPAAIAVRARTRRRRQRALAGGAAMALILVVGAGTLVAQSLGPRDAAREVVPQGTLHRVPVPEVPSAPSIPYCEPRSGDRTSDVLHVGGVAFATPCDWSPHRRYLWYHEGRTVTSSQLTGLEVLVGDRLVQLSDAAPVHPRISLDGRYLAWFEGEALVVFDFAVETRVARAPVPDGMRGASFATLVGVDPDERAYVLLDGGVVWVLKEGGRWTRVRGLPTEWTDGPSPWISYLTTDGFAVAVRDISAGQPVAASVEGRVTQDGVFEPVRTVPLGLAVWSPDRSRVVQLTGEGFRAHPADNLRSSVVLDVPVDPADVPQVVWDAQWESSASVLVTSAVTSNGAVGPDGSVIHRCSAVTGDCMALPGGIGLPLSAGAHPGG